MSLKGLALAGLGGLLGVAAVSSALCYLVLGTFDLLFLAIPILYVLGAPVILAGAYAGAYGLSHAAEIARQPQADWKKRAGPYMLAGAMLLPPALFIPSSHFGPEPPPTDAEMIRFYEAHRAEFNQLETQLGREKDFDKPSNALWILQDNFCRTHHLEFKPDQTAQGPETDFERWNYVRGFWGDIEEKGFAYRKSRPEPIYRSLDKIDHSTDFRKYRYLGSNWYLYYDYVPD